MFALIEKLFTIPFLSIIVFTPVALLVSNLHKKKVISLTGDKIDIKALGSYFHHANINLISGIYATFISLISFPIHGPYMYSKGVIVSTLIPIVLLIGFIFSLKFWYTYNNKWLKVLYTMYTIFLLYPFWFAFTFFYFVYVVFNGVFISKDNSQRSGNKIFGIVFTIFLLLAGGSLLVYWELYIERMLYF